MDEPARIGGAVTWLKLDDKFVRHPKVQGLSDAAFRLHLAAMGHCAEYTTDGRIASHVVVTLTAHPDKAPLIKEMVDAGLWEAMVGGWEVHDFLRYNPSAEQIKARRNHWRSRQDKHRVSRRDTPRDAARESRVTPGSGTGSGSDPDPEGVQGEPARSEPRLKSVPPLAPDEPPEAVEVGPVSRADWYSLADRIWNELWSAKYRRRYEQTGGRLTGRDSEDSVLVRMGERASIRGPGAEAFLRHKIGAYLKDPGDRNWLAENCHPLRTIERSWNKYGEPKEPRRAVRAEPPVELVSVEEMAARGAAAAAMKLVGSGGT